MGETEICSHGRYPVAKLRAGMAVRFYSRDCGRQVILHIEKVVQFNKMIILKGPEFNGVGFWIGDWVELVST